LQVNISREDSKSGCLPENLPELAAKVSHFPGIRVRGLMAIPKASHNEVEQQQAFAAMQKLFRQLQTDYPTWDTLSMGMSGDMSIAVAEGATIVRIGTAIFGPRPAKQ
ncbi:MAG: YggS family pyridoxal phosphate-dependent enzyme, partial [Cellvibrionaceae bacterium]|nr:YggS family pyridoxal phosphate-dependent enzyme [Cellvibrionaceae bacterium]